MNITIISNNYFPEDSGIGLYSSGMAAFLARTHTVNVIAATPYYPQWKIYPEYAGQPAFTQEDIQGVHIYRFRQYTPQVPTFKGRIIQMLHFFSGSLINILKIKKSDITIVVVPFTVNAVLGWFLKLLRGGKLWIHIQDFEFDAAFETGLSANKTGFLARTVFNCERFIFNRADVVSTISGGMLKKLASKTDRPRIYFPNWIDHSKINPAEAKPSDRYDLSKFNILYSGNIGAKQDWEFFVNFAQALSDVPQMHITLIGEGAKCKDVLKSIESLDNVTYFPPVRYEELNDLLCSASVHILFQKNTVVDTVMPSKILGMMASGVPSVVTGHEDSEVRKNFEQAAYGYYFSDGNIPAIRQKLIALSENGAQSKAMGERGRAFVVSNFSYEAIMQQLQSDIEKITSA